MRVCRNIVLAGNGKGSVGYRTLRLRYSCSPCGDESSAGVDCTTSKGDQGMNSRFLCRLLIVPAALLGSGVATAQIEEVVVTAQRRAESMQDVPITVSAVTADTLQTLGAIDVLGPGFDCAGTVCRAPARLPADLPARDRHDQRAGRTGIATALYVDGVYYAELPGLNFSFNNIERIEVLADRRARSLAATQPGAW